MSSGSPIPHYNAVVIGSGFGGTMTALTLAREFKKRGRGETLHMLERGTWWTTPVGTVQDKEVKTAEFLRQKKQPVQYWSSAEHLRGFIDIVLRCVRRKGNEDGLYDLTKFGKSGFLGMGAENDGVSILRANGVGGGSLVYANVTIQPPDLVFNDTRWPVKWEGARNDWYDLARNAIGLGVLNALDTRDAVATPAPPVNTGLSNIATRSARLDPRWKVVPDPNNKRGIKRIDLTKSDPKGDHSNDLWIDRARVFQTAMADNLADDYGTVDSSINDITPEPTPFDPKGAPKNYCERQGRCIVGCLPGARHTLNKQLMAAVLGKFDGTAGPIFPDMSLQALAEVDTIRAREEGGYEIAYAIRSADDPSQTTASKITADRVIVAAGCVGTNEIMLRSHRPGFLPHLSGKVGYGFSTNGDYLAFLENTRERVSLTRGPVTTSFAHFQKDPAKFHTIEDNGIPRALSSVTGLGVPLARSLSNGTRGRLLIIWTLILWLLRRFGHYVAAFFRDASERQDVFQSEDEYTNNMMCIAAMGREASIGQFRLGGKTGETALRVARTDGKGFHEDPIYDAIRASLDQFAEKLTGDKTARFLNPFLTPAADALGSKSISLSHPLGGCRMAENADEGVVDEYGRVFDTSKSGGEPFYPGLYIADGAMIPTALGVNPSLTISALSLRIAKKIVEGLA